MNIRYSKQEDRIIMKLVGAYPANLQYAFELAASQLKGRKAGAIENRYYRVLKESGSKELMLVSRNGHMPANVKVMKRPKDNGSIALEVAEKALSRLTREEKLILADRLLS